MRFNSSFDPAAILTCQRTEPSTPSIQLCNTESRCDVLFSGEVVGVMNMKTSRPLKSVCQASHIRLAGFAKPSCPSQSDNTSSKKDLRYCLIDVLIFGHRIHADSIARGLAANNFYLQDPDHTPLGFSYENPQCLDLPNIPEAKDDSESRMGILPTIDIVQSQNEDSDLDFDRLLDEFACHDDLAQATAVAHVSTPLLRYVTYSSSMSTY